MVQSKGLVYTKFYRFPVERTIEFLIITTEHIHKQVKKYHAKIILESIANIIFIRVPALTEMLNLRLTFFWGSSKYDRN